MNILKRIATFWTSEPAKNHSSDLANAYNGNITISQEEGLWRVVLLVAYMQQPQYLGKDNSFYPKPICSCETTGFTTKEGAISQVNKHFESVREWTKHTLSDTRKSCIYATTI